jgi:hypothetical protein
VKLGLTLRGERRLKVFEYRMLRRIFGPKREEVAGGWRRQHNEELHKLYASANIIRLIKSRKIWVGHVARMVETRNAYNISAGETEVKRPLGRPSCRWKDNIKLVIRKICWEIVDSIHLAHVRASGRIL